MIISKIKCAFPDVGNISNVMLSQYVEIALNIFWETFITLRGHRIRKTSSIATVIKWFFAVPSVFLTLPCSRQAYENIYESHMHMLARFYGGRERCLKKRTIHPCHPTFYVACVVCDTRFITEDSCHENTPCAWVNVACPETSLSVLSLFVFLSLPLRACACTRVHLPFLSRYRVLWYLVLLILPIKFYRTYVTHQNWPYCHCRHATGITMFALSRFSDSFYSLRC